MADSTESILGRPGWSVIRETVSDRNFLLYSIAMTASKTAFYIIAITVTWMTWEITESGAWLGGINAAMLGAALFLGPFGGALADRIGLLRAIKLCQILYIAILLAFSVYLYFYTPTIEFLLAFAILQGLVGSILIPTEIAFVRSIVSDRHLVASVQIATFIFGIGRLVGPTIAALLITTSLSYPAFAAITAHVLCLLGLLCVRVPKTANSPENGSVNQTLAGPGIRHTFKLFSGNTVFIVLLTLFSLTLIEPDYIVRTYANFAEISVTHFQNFGSFKSWLLLLIAIPITLWIASRASFRNFPQYLAWLFVAMCLSIVIAGGAFGLAGDQILILAIPLISYSLAAAITGILVLAIFLLLLPRSVLATGIGIMNLTQAVLTFLVGDSLTHIYDEPFSSIGWAILNLAILVLILYRVWVWLHKRWHHISASLSEPGNTQLK